MNAVTVDVGGSGTRFGVINRSGELEIHSKRDVNSVSDLLAGIRTYSRKPSSVGVSMAGKVNSRTCTVGRSVAAPWAQGPLRQTLQTELENCPVRVMNDGEAHALAMLAMPEVDFGAIAISLGTAVGFGALDSDRRVMRPCSGDSWDVGDVCSRQARRRRKPGGPLDLPVSMICSTVPPHAL